MRPGPARTVTAEPTPANGDRQRAPAPAAAEVAECAESAAEADESFHRVPAAALGNDAIVSVLDQFGPVVRRAERMRFAADGQASLERHERLIALLASGDVEGAAGVAFETWHTLSVDDEPSPERG
ncbi:FCD domain-containing protein [Microbacterium sp. LWO12-1.2]|uniref:FCD domain-containing protein n=1 Tax=Microbacterium sp. LWO12-1.2 TaxID=3135261 RepID=UPI003436E504